MSKRRQLNVIMVCFDELRARSVGYVSQEPVLTPCLDELASNGVSFTSNFCNHPICGPSRKSMVTGKYSSTVRYWCNQVPMAVGEENLAAVLRARDYQTVLAGKDHTFDGNMAMSITHRLPLPEAEPPETVPSRDMPWESYYRGKMLSVPHDTKVVDRAIDFISGSLTRPFFMMVNINFPHPPYQAPEPYFSMHDRATIPLPAKADVSRKPIAAKLMRERCKTDRLSDDDWRELIATYYGMICHGDALLGRMLSALDRAGLRDDTLIVVWSDHGDFAGQYQLVEKWSTSLYDCICNTPLVFSGPGIPADTTFRQLTENVDIAPTLLDLLGIEGYEGIMGRSLVPLINGKTHATREAVFCEGGLDRIALLNPGNRNNPQPKQKYQPKQSILDAEPMSYVKSKMVRTAKHKLIWRVGATCELYDLGKDPDELENVYGRATYREVEGDLKTRLLNWCFETEQAGPELRGLLA